MRNNYKGFIIVYYNKVFCPSISYTANPLGAGANYS